MPSYARRHQLQQSLIYHVYNRGNLRLELFHAAPDYCHYLKLIKEYSISFGAKVYHWALMPNHYHLLLELDIPEDLSVMMAGLNRAYTHYYHATYQTAGFLWQGRFKSRPIEKERYLVACGRYIERNPVRAGIVLEAKDYQYSSARFYCTGEPDGLTGEDPVIFGFSDDIAKRQNYYVEFLRKFDSEEDKLFDKFEHPLGSREFMRRLLIINGRYVPRRRGGIPLSPKTLVV